MILHRTPPAFLLFVLLNPVGTAADAQTPPSPRVVQATRALQPIKIDGNLDDEGWSAAPPFDDFRQREPIEGEPASERTEIRVLYDDRQVYFGIRAYSSNPLDVRGRELSRDASFANDDRVDILLDTYHDRRSAFRFTVNPLGTQQDALITDEGRVVNVSWDAPWISAGHRDDLGYVVEIAIPLSVLRYNEGADTWGLNVSRTIRHRNEEVLWSGWERTFGLERVSEAGALVGLKGLQRRRLAELKPYASNVWNEMVPTSTGIADTRKFAGGLEVARLGISSSITAELTVNPDFGQAEADQQVINLSRFSVFFPEKRDFFLEGAGAFLFGREGGNQMYFSRRIGLSDQGSQVPIDYGAKVTGKGGAYNVGLLHVQSRAVGEFVPRSRFTAARLKRDILGRSSVGIMLVSRHDSISEKQSQAGGIDAQLNLTDHLKLFGFLMATGSDAAFSGRTDVRYETDRFRLVGVYEDIGKNFAPSMGFVERTDIRQYFYQAAYKPRPRFLPFVRRMDLETQLEYYEERSTRRLSTRRHAQSWETEFNNSAVLFARPIEATTDVLTQPFEIRPGITIPVGEYRFNRPRIAFSSDRSKTVVVSASDKWGDFYSGTRHEFDLGVTLRPNPHIAVDLTNSFNDVALPQGQFSTNLFGTKLALNFSRRLLTSAFVQVNSAAQLSSVNVRFRYIFRPNSDIYAIYNQTTGKGVDRPSRQYQLKMTYHLAR